MGRQRQTCPRRMLEMGPWKYEEGLDQWERDHGLVGFQERELSCSFCGSLHPDRFMELLEQGWVVGPTDKNYKAYLSEPVSEAAIAERKKAWLEDPKGIARTIRSAWAADGKSEEETDQKIAKLWREQEMLLMSGGQEAKFYYQHLTPEQGRRFVDLYNNGTMRIGYPGNFYVMPFFMRSKNQNGTQ